MQCKTCDPPRLSPIHMVNGPAVWWATTGDGWLEAWFAEDAIQTGKEAPTAPPPPALPSHKQGT